MKILSRRSLVVIGLAVLFFAPGLAAVLFFQHPQWLGGHTTNKGELIKPAVFIQGLAHIDGVSKDAKWHLLLWGAGDCDQHCFIALDKLMRIRLALGRHYYEVNQVLMLPDAMSPALLQRLNILKKSDTKLLYLTQKEMNLLRVDQHHRRIFIADPQGFVVLSYAVTADSDDVYRDIKHLLIKSN